MILAIDVGNTNLAIGVYDAEKLRHHWRLSTDRSLTADEYGMRILALFQHVQLGVEAIKGVIISSVVPPIMMALEQMCESYLHHRPLIVSAKTATGLKLKIDHPAELGADRLVNAVAAVEKYGYPVMVVDFGTATTVCYIDEHGDYAGGAIAPGIGIATEALYQRAAKLPRIELVAPLEPVGKNTVQAMQAGIVFGFAGQVDGIVSRMCESLAVKPTVIATGGLAPLIAKEAKTIDVLDPFLTLDGLRILYELKR
jgi:type III pantothenate kinase